MNNFNSHWEENIRNETLTSFFKIFPYFASDYFYIIILAVGYWISVRKKLFIDLGFLIPAATLINIILKNLFAIARPPQFLHLVPYHIDYGFPSGDVQVATVFWGMIILHSNSTIVRICSWSMIIGISASRVYLGVHSVIDVLGALIFGFIILLIFNSSYYCKLRDRWLEDSTKSYWYISLLIGLVYAATIYNKPLSNLSFASIGALIGLGVSLRTVKIIDLKQKASVFQALCSLIILFISYKFFPSYRISDFIFYLSVTIKYAILTLMIYILIPLLQSKINENRWFTQRN